VNHLMMHAAQTDEVARTVVAARGAGPDVMQVEPQAVAAVGDGATMPVLLEDAPPRGRRDAVFQPRRGVGRREVEHSASHSAHARSVASARFGAAGSPTCVFSQSGQRCSVTRNRSAVGASAAFGGVGVGLEHREHPARHLGEQRAVLDVRPEPALEAQARERRGEHVRVGRTHHDRHPHARRPGLGVRIGRRLVAPLRRRDLSLERAVRRLQRAGRPGGVRLGRRDAGDLAGLGVTDPARTKGRIERRERAARRFATKTRSRVCRGVRSSSASP
jgi:hypothetical protein